MTPLRIVKRLERALLISWREQPTRYDIEALQDNIRRVGLVVRMRWVLVFVLATYSVCAAGLYSTRMDPSELTRLMVIPAASLAFVVCYNMFYQLNYRRLGTISVWNNLQLALDSVVVSVLVYYSGGVHSWFWSMYALFILEAAFILKQRSAAWFQAAFCIVLLASIEWLEYFRILQHVSIPFSDKTLHTNTVFVAIRFLWQLSVLTGTAAVASRLMGTQREELHRRESLCVLDETTGLHSRSYFLRESSIEERRAHRDGRTIHLVLVDVDRFGEFNRRFGIEAGDELLERIASEMVALVSPTHDLAGTANLIARTGGEEFSLLLVEDENGEGPLSVEAAVRLAEKVRVAVGNTRVNDAGVTISVGVASSSPVSYRMQDLQDEADGALARAIELGGNRVVVAEERDASGAPDSTE